MAVFTHVMPYDVDWDMLGTMGRAPCTRENLPDFRESGRVTRHSQVFCRLTGSQRTPGFWGVTQLTGLQKSGKNISRYNSFFSSYFGK